jgi:hypothetical protein
MHLSLEQFNLLLERRASQEQRDLWTDHILDCGQCGDHFRALNALDQQANPARQARRIPLRYLLGVAAVMIMCITPYVSHRVSPGKEKTQFASIDLSSSSQSAQLSVLGRVKDVNYRHSLDQWGQSTNLTDLLRNR